MIRQAIECDDPVMFLEPKCRYWEKGEVDEAAPPAGLFEAAVRREGTDVTLVAYGPSVKTCLAAEAAADAEGHERRGDRPALDLAARRRHGRSAPSRRPAGSSSPTRHQCSRGIGGEIAARLTERCFYSLSAPPLRVGGYHTPYPPSRVEEDYLPNIDRLLDALDRALAY